MLFHFNGISVCAVKTWRQQFPHDFTGPLAMRILIYLTKFNIRDGSCFAYCWGFKSVEKCTLCDILANVYDDFPNDDEIEILFL